MAVEAIGMWPGVCAPSMTLRMLPDGEASAIPFDRKPQAQSADGIWLRKHYFGASVHARHKRILNALEEVSDETLTRHRRSGVRLPTKANVFRAHCTQGLGHISSSGCRAATLMTCLNPLVHWGTLAMFVDIGLRTPGEHPRRQRRMFGGEAAA